MATFIQEGVYLDHTPEAALAQGEVVAIKDDFFGVATAAIAAGVKGALAVQGVFEFDSDGEIPAGALVYWNSVTSKVSATPANDCYIGRAVAAAADDKCRVALNASNIGEFTAITPVSAPTLTQATVAAFTAANPAAITAVNPDAATAAPADDDLTELIADVASIRTQLTAAIADITAVRAEVVKLVTDFGTTKTALNAAKTDIAAVVSACTTAGIFE